MFGSFSSNYIADNELSLDQSICFETKLIFRTGCLGLSALNEKKNYYSTSITVSWETYCLYISPYMQQKLSSN